MGCYKLGGISMSTIKRVAIVGTGAVGSALARNFTRHGIAVQLASSDLAKTREDAGVIGATVTEVATGALRDVDAIFLAVPATAARAVLEAATGLAPRTIVVDCTNPITW